MPFKIAWNSIKHSVCTHIGNVVYNIGQQCYLFFSENLLSVRVYSGSSKIVIILKRVHRLRWGQWSLYCLKNYDYDALHMHTRSLKINIFKVLFSDGGVTKKSTLCTLLIMLIIWTTPYPNLTSWCLDTHK